MLENALKPSNHFRKMANKAVWAIVLFVFTYLVLVLAAVGLIIVCSYAGLMLIAFKVMLPTLLLGGGLICFGFLILIFLVKFIFKVNKTDRSHLTQITEPEQPELFKLINETVLEVGTDFPKKVYLSAEVNASVFYDSSFWSMFLPVRKNLQIGIGLMNTISIDELKAILAHEFGHFSQKSMRVGSYVYNVNQIIYNMLYDNEGYGNLAQRLAQVSNFIAIFVVLSNKIATGIQYILKKIYEVVNLNHLALSREMEFHADAVAASVAGCNALITSLHRLQLADYSLNKVFDYYNGKIKDKEKTANIYPQQKIVMNFYADLQDIKFENNLPLVSDEHYNKFNKNKLVLKDQWASHPSTKERVEQLKKLNYPVKSYKIGFATDLLANKEMVLNQITKKLFDTIEYGETPIISDESKFEADFLNEQKLGAYHRSYRGYYDFRNPLTDLQPDVFEKPGLSIPLKLTDLINDDHLDLIYQHDGITGDINTLKQIEDGSIEIKTFDYDGKRYSKADCQSLLIFLNEELEELNSRLENLDLQLFEYFLALAIQQQKVLAFRSLYDHYKLLVSNLAEQTRIHTKIVDLTAFMHTSTPFDTIEQNMYLVKDEELIFKEHFKQLVANPLYQEQVTQKEMEKIAKFIESNNKYFSGGSYFQMQVDEIFDMIMLFAKIINDTNFNAKKELLDFQADLEIVNLSETNKPVAI